MSILTIRIKGIFTWEDCIIDSGADWLDPKNNDVYLIVY